MNDALEDIRDACSSDRNIMEPIIHAAKAYSTLGEIVQEMKDVFNIADYDMVSLFNRVIK